MICARPWKISWQRPQRNSTANSRFSAKRKNIADKIIKFNWRPFLIVCAMLRMFLAMLFCPFSNFISHFNWSNMIRTTVEVDFLQFILSASCPMSLSTVYASALREDLVNIGWDLCIPKISSWWIGSSKSPLILLNVWSIHLVLGMILNLIPITFDLKKFP